MQKISATQHFIMLSILQIIVITTVAVGAYTYGRASTMSEIPVTPIDTMPVACTMEAKICPDGSAVGRSGPKCEFAPCPTQTLSNTKTKMGFTLSLPLDMVVLKDTSQQTQIGFEVPEVSGIHLTFSKLNSISVDTLPKCTNSSAYPCLNSDIEKMTVGGKSADSFYILSGSVDSDEHVVQVPGEFEARTSIAGGGLDQNFTKILDSISF